MVLNVENRILWTKNDDVMLTSHSSSLLVDMMSQCHLISTNLYFCLQAWPQKRQIKDLADSKRASNNAIWKSSMTLWRLLFKMPPSAGIFVTHPSDLNEKNGIRAANGKRLVLSSSQTRPIMQSDLWYFYMSGCKLELKIYQRQNNVPSCNCDCFFLLLPIVCSVLQGTRQSLYHSCFVLDFLISTMCGSIPCIYCYIFGAKYQPRSFIIGYYIHPVLLLKEHFLD